MATSDEIVRRGYRSETIGVKQLKRELRAHVPELGDEQLRSDLEAVRPKSRADCELGERPCVFVACRYNLFLDVTAAGSITLNFPGQDLDELAETCALDVAERDRVTLEEVGSLMNVTRERIRQIETQALTRIAAAPEVA